MKETNLNLNIARYRFSRPAGQLSERYSSDEISRMSHFPKAKLARVVFAAGSTDSYRSTQFLKRAPGLTRDKIELSSAVRWLPRFAH